MASASKFMHKLEDKDVCSKKLLACLINLGVFLFSNGSPQL